MNRAAAVMMWVLMGACAFAASFSGNLLVRPDWDHESGGITTVKETFSTLFNWTFTSGTNTNQMDQLWRDRRELANGGTETIDLAGGITNAFGDVLTMAEVRMVIVSLPATNLNTISVGGATNNTFSTWLGDDSDTVVVRPGGFLLLVGPDNTGYAVSTNGNLRITNGGTNGVSYDLYVGGASQ